jgi:ABC-2 type transport system ATP-binding protein
VAGLDILEEPHEIRKRIGYLPEVAPLYSEMTVRGYLEFAAKLRGLDGSKVRARLDDVLAVTRIRGVAEQVIGTLSAGYKQRVGIAQAVVHGPELLVLDEPFAGLDPVQTVEMREMIRGLGGKHTVLLSSHLLAQIHETCDRILVIDRGRITAEGNEKELAAQHGAGRERLEVVVRYPDETYRDNAGSLIEQTLSDIGGFESCEATEIEGGIVKALVTASEDIREEVAAALVGASWGLRGLRMLEPELESLFVDLARGEGEEGAS